MANTDFKSKNMSPTELVFCYFGILCDFHRVSKELNFNLFWEAT